MNPPIYYLGLMLDVSRTSHGLLLLNPFLIVPAAPTEQPDEAMENSILPGRYWPTSLTHSLTFLDTWEPEESSSSFSLSAVQSSSARPVLTLQLNKITERKWLVDRASTGKSGRRPVQRGFTGFNRNGTKCMESADSVYGQVKRLHASYIYVYARISQSSLLAYHR